jgi:thymidylate synthase
MNYLEIIKNVLENGTPKQATRLDQSGKVIPVENGTIGTFCEILRHDMSQGFPLTTLRKMPWLSIRVELEGFIKGVTDKEWYQKRKCKFWDEWANPKLVEDILTKDAHDIFGMAKKPITAAEEESYKKQYRKTVQKETADLGPIYGYQWRNFDQHYEDFSKERRYFDSVKKYTTGNDFWDYHGAGCPNTELHGHVYGFDQLKSIVDKLKTNPYDRRMVCSAWNPNQMDMMALPPCHWGFNVVVYGDKLNLIWHQRSCDLLLGVGANIASYALLLELLAKEANLVPGELVGTLADCHIYENHLDAARELVSRSENELPKLVLDSESIFDFSPDQATLLGYNPYDKIDVGSVTV